MVFVLIFVSPKLLCAALPTHTFIFHNTEKTETLTFNKCIMSKNFT